MAMRPARRTATAALLATVLACAGPAAAETATLARGAMSLVGTPVDLALTPYTAGSAFVRKYYVNGKQSALEKALMTPVMGMVAKPCSRYQSQVAAFGARPEPLNANTLPCPRGA